jgi:hypothetical protein
VKGDWCQDMLRERQQKLQARSRGDRFNHLRQISKDARVFAQRELYPYHQSLITNHAAFVCCLGCKDRNWLGCISKKRRNMRRK